MRSRLIWFMLFRCIATCLGQSEPQDNTDALLGVQDADINYEDQLETMSLLLTDRIDLNHTSANELRLLNILDEFQINQLLTYLSENGKLISIYELQAVPGFDLQTINKIRGRVSVKDPSGILSIQTLRQQVSEGSHYIIARYSTTLEKKRGYQDNVPIESKFIGPPGKSYFKLRSSKPGNYSIGITAENDDGEKFQWSQSNRQYGFDFLSMHMRLENKGIIKNVIIGDYLPQFGQGLTLGGAFGYGKGSETITAIKRVNLGFIPYSSSNESMFLRGLATTLTVSKKFSLSVGVSAHFQDSGIGTDTLEASSTSIITAGLHRNLTERSKRATNRESNIIANFDYHSNQLQVGVIAHRIEFSNKVYPRNQVYNQNSFRGSENLNIGFYFNYTHNNIHTFGEMTQSVNHGYGYIAGLMLSLSASFDIALVRRHYQENFYTFYSNAFSENSSPQNEIGNYWGWKYQPTRRLTLSGYVDIFTFPWLRFRSYRPSTGNEWLLSAIYKPTRATTLRLQYREEQKERNAAESSMIYHPLVGVKRNYLLAIVTNPAKKLRFGTRVQGSTYTHSAKTTKGIALYQDMSLTIGKLKLSVRHAIFETDDFDNRQYAYEKDVWLAYSLPAVSGMGVRNYFLTEYTFSKMISLWIKYTRIRYHDQEEIGSGLDVIQGSSKNDVKVQLRLRL